MGEGVRGEVLHNGRVAPMVHAIQQTPGQPSLGCRHVSHHICPTDPDKNSCSVGHHTEVGPHPGEDLGLVIVAWCEVHHQHSPIRVCDRVQVPYNGNRILSLTEASRHVVHTHVVVLLALGRLSMCEGGGFIQYDTHTAGGGGARCALGMEIEVGPCHWWDCGVRLHDSEVQAWVKEQEGTIAHTTPHAKREGTTACEVCMPLGA
mmetsp:Transcript_72103/g.127072  ORF Transcript_72103/g.127072 Transcript_72103/m.127072 type:complete len:205 (+) Transcript_72103:316-930(+)